MIRRLLFIGLLAIAGVASATEGVRPFVLGSMTQIQEEHAGKPFVLFLWSLTCTYCPTELKMLGEFKQQHPDLNLVLIAAGVFAEDMPERLRFEIDRRWYGEVPRTYFYDQSHQREAKTGLVGQEYVKSWLARVGMDASSASK